MNRFWLGLLIGGLLGAALVASGREPIEATFRLWPRDATKDAIALAFALGAAIFLLALDVGHQSPAKSLASLAAWSLGIAVASATLTGLLLGAGSVAHVIRFLLFGLSAAATGLVSREMSRSSKDEGLELRSIWGGLGDGLGGWELSRPAALLLLAIIFATTTFWAGFGLTAAADQSARTEPPAKIEATTKIETTPAAPRSPAPATPAEK
jgi:hypothetical protein